MLASPAPVDRTSPHGRRLRVLLLINEVVDNGGAERFVLGLARYLPPDRIEPWVCSTRIADPDAVRSLDALGIPHINLGRRAKWDVHRLATLAPLLRRERFDVLHSHMFGSNLWGTMLGRACNVPVVLPHEHMWSYAGNPVRAWLDGQLIGRLATRFVTVSAASREQMVSIEHVRPEKVVVMPTAYIPSLNDRGDIRDALGLPAGTPLIGVVAALRPEKALSVLLDAHRRVLEQVREAHLVIAGDGLCLPALRQQASDLGMSASVHFLGDRDDVDSILQQVDVAALPSDWEGMPLFALECMAAGAPLVATAVGGLPDLVEHGKTGLLVPPRDPDALAKALTSVLLDRGLRERLAAAAALRLDAYRIETVAERFADLYEELRAAAGPLTGG